MTPMGVTATAALSGLQYVVLSPFICMCTFMYEDKKKEQKSNEIIM